jgi:hypothetical protein
LKLSHRGSGASHFLLTKIESIAKHKMPFLRIAAR